MAGLFAAINAHANPGPAVAGAWNGATGVVAIGDNTEHIKEKNKLVVDINGIICLAETLANQALHITEQQPLAAGGAAVVVNANAFESVKRSWSDMIGNHEVYRLLALAGINLGWRTSDVLPVASFQAHWNGQEANWMNFAQQMLDYLHVTPGAMADFAASTHFCALNLLRAHHHRNFTEGHNGYSDQTQRKGTRSNNLTALAGKDREAFQNWLNIGERCHDDFHALNDQCMANACDAATGHVPAQIPAGHVVNGEMINVPMNVHEALNLGQAAVDRHPPGALGLSGAILVIQAIQMFMGVMRLKFNNGPQVSGTLVALLDALRNDGIQTTMTRTHIIAITNAVTPIGAFAIGFISSNTAHREWIEGHASLLGLAKRESTHYLNGNTLGKEVAGMAVQPGNVVNTINGHMADLNSAIINVGNQVAAIMGAAPPGPAANAIANLQPIPAHVMANWA